MVKDPDGCIAGRQRRIGGDIFLSPGGQDENQKQENSCYGWTEIFFKNY
jgi:hypothetical protein